MKGICKKIGEIYNPISDFQGYVSYFEICKLMKSSSWTEHKDDTGNVYLHNAENGHWVGYDTQETVERKVI